MTYDETLQILSILTSAFPTFDLKANTVKVYAKCLEDIPFDVCQAAALSHITRQKFFPSISELRAAAVDLNPQNRVPDAEEAWLIVTRAVKGNGRTAKPTFANAVVAKVVDEIGWSVICSSDAFGKVSFLSVYREVARRFRDDLLELPSVKKLRQAGESSQVYLLPETDNAEFLAKYGTRETDADE